MGEPDLHPAVDVGRMVTMRTAVLWAAFVLCQAASQVTHYLGPQVLPSWWDVARWLLAVTLALGGWIVIDHRFRRSAVVVVVAGTLSGQFQTLRWLSALLVWRWRGFAP